MPVVVGVDGSASAAHAVDWAATEAARRGVTLVLVHAGAQTPPWLAQRRAAAAERGAPRVEVQVTEGRPAAVLLDRARSAALVVVGGWGTDALSGMLAGSVAMALVTHAPCTVAVVRGPTPEAVPPADGPVVVGIDGGPADDAVLDLAFGIAESGGAELQAVHTFSDIVPGPDGSAVRSREDWDVLQQRARALLSDRIAAYRAAHPAVQVDEQAVADRPARRFLGLAERARLLVVGHRGSGGFSGMLLGSTSQVLVQYAPCPVLVVRPAADRRPSAGRPAPDGRTPG